MALAWIGSLTVFALLLTVWYPLDLLGRSPEVLLLGKCLNPCGHLGGFALLAVLTLATRWPRKRLVLFLILPLLAVGSELIQFAFPRHTPEIGDVLLDLTGIALSIICWHWLRGGLRFRPRRVAAGG